MTEPENKRTEDQDVADTAETVEETTETTPDLSFDDWLSTLGSGTENDTMLRFAPTSANSIDITHGHPSGLTQLMTGRRTRLSTLLRDTAPLTQARRTATQISAKIDELSADRGIDVGYMAAGIATWRATESGHSQQMSAPVLLAQVSLTQRSGREDAELQLTGRARLNPALARFFATQYGIQLDRDEYERAAYITAKLEPQNALDLLRSHSATVRGLIVENRTLVSTFADLADTASADVVDPEHPVVKALYNAATGETPAQKPVLPDTGLPPLDARDPNEELLVVDMEPSQQTAVDHIAAGHNIVVTAAPGTGQTQTAVAGAVALAAQGKRVLVVAERTSTLEDFRSRLADVKLDSLVLDIPASSDTEILRTQLINALLRTERATEPAVQRIHTTVRERRHQLSDHVESLHEVRERWGCSPFQAMRALAQLTSLDPAPASTVRLKRSVLDATVNRETVTEQLRRAAELGSFSHTSTASPWYGARLRNVQEAEDAATVVEELRDQVSVVQNKLTQATEHAQLRIGTTAAEWFQQIALLEQVRTSLDHFTPDIFDRPVTDLIAATASSAWRKQHGVEMSAMTRSRLRRVAKEYVRPGVHVDDLHTALLRAQQQLSQWTQWATSQRHPTIPSGMEKLAVEGAGMAEQMNRLQTMLAPPAEDSEKLENLPIADLVDTLDRLVKDQETLHSLPERTLVMDQLRDQGLAELVADFQQREVTADMVGPELDVAWWQSALEAMISGDDYLAMMDGAELRRIDSEYRLADAAHLAAGPDRLRWQLAQAWRTATSEHPAGARVLRSVLKDGEPDPHTLAGVEQAILQPLVPIWTSSPLALAELPAPLTFDAVLLLDAETLAVSAGLGALCRAEQTVAFGDAISGRPRSFQVSVDPTASAHTPRDVESVHSALCKVLPQVRLKVMHRGLSQRFCQILSEQLYDGELTRLPEAEEFTGARAPSGTGVRVEYLPQGSASPARGDDGVESTAREVNRTVDAVFEHLRDHPTQSLAVITASPLHARRVAEALRMNLPNNRWAAPFFAAATAPGGEPFVVAPMERASGLVRDTILFSLGYGRTTHGRVVHHFGPLSEQHGLEYYATAMTRARRHLHLLTCIHPDEVDPERVTGAAHHFWQLLEAYVGTGQNRFGSTATTQDTDIDPLTADVAALLAESGATVAPDYAGEIDLAAWNQRGLPTWHDDSATGAADAPVLPLALSSDGSDDYRAMSVRERSRLRPEQLERRGWRHLPLWTIDVFANPVGVAEELLGHLGLTRTDTDTDTDR